jgi:hypothetical protein
MSAACHLCSTTRFICFWGELRPYRPWRRVSLLICSLAIACGIAALFHFFFGRPGNWFVWAIAAVMFPISILGMLAAIWGCNSCVVRLHGDV